MYLNDFSVRIPQGTETPGGYVELEHDTRYTLVLRNNRNTQCDARVEIDGQHVGTWRLYSHQSITLEHPASDDGHFTFYKLGTKEARQSNLNGSNANLGLVKVTFTPEKEEIRIKDFQPWATTYTDASQWAYTTSSSATSKGLVSTNYASESGASMHSAGGTGLSGHSSQQYGYASSIQLDYSQQTVIHLRLVCRDSNNIRPLTSYSTPVPPPIR